MALYFFFALFPVLLLLLILLGGSAGDGSEWRGALLDSFKQVLPQDAAALITQTVQQLNAGAVRGAGAILAGVYAAWGSLNGTWAIMTGLNKAYEVEEKRPWWRVLYIMLSLTTSLSILGLLALAAMVYGNRIGNHLQFLQRAVQWAAILILLLLSFAALYRFGPNLKDRRWQWSIPGAVAAVTLWIPFTVLLRVYQEHFGTSRIYGKLNAVATLLLSLYVTGAVIFIGGEANSEIEKAAAEAGHPDVRAAGERRSGGEGTSDR